MVVPYSRGTTEEFIHKFWSGCLLTRKERPTIWQNHAQDSPESQGQCTLGLLCKAERSSTVYHSVDEEDHMQN